MTFKIRPISKNQIASMTFDEVIRLRLMAAFDDGQLDDGLNIEKILSEIKVEMETYCKINDIEINQG